MIDFTPLLDDLRAIAHDTAATSGAVFWPVLAIVLVVGAAVLWGLVALVHLGWELVR